MALQRCARGFGVHRYVLLGLVEEPKRGPIHVRQGCGHEAATVIVFEWLLTGLERFLGSGRGHDDDGDKCRGTEIRKACFRGFGALFMAGLAQEGGEPRSLGNAPLF